MTTWHRNFGETAMKVLGTEGLLVEDDTQLLIRYRPKCHQRFDERVATFSISPACRLMSPAPSRSASLNASAASAVFPWRP